MLKRLIVIGPIVALAGCAGEQPVSADFEVSAPLYAKGGNSIDNLGTHLVGEEEVPGRETLAQGQAIFRITGNSVDFRLIASNIDNVHMAHIHCGRFGENGPIRMWLHPVIGPSGIADTDNLGSYDGVLANGTFSAAGVVCAAANVGANMPLIDAMRAGLTYVNVHTTDNQAPTNTGPGDFPGGEVRGQLDAGR